MSANNLFDCALCKLDETREALMRSAMNQMNLSARAYQRILKLARRIADLAGSDAIQQAHLAEALHLRQAEVDDCMTGDIPRGALA